MPTSVSSKLKRSITLEEIEFQFENHPEKMIQYVESSKQLGKDTEFNNHYYSDLQALAKNKPDYLFMGYPLDHNHLVYVGIKRSDDIAKAEIEYLWVHPKNEPIYYRVPLDQIQSLIIR